MKLIIPNKISFVVLFTVIIAIIASLQVVEAIQYYIAKERMFENLINEARQKAKAISVDLKESIWYINTRFQTDVMRSFLIHENALGIRVYGTITPEAILGFVKDGDEVKTLHGDPKGNNYVEATSPIIYEGKEIGFVKIFLSKSSVEHTLSLYIQWSIWRASFLSLLIGVILIILLRKLLLIPLAKLYEATNRVRQGDYQYRIDFSASNELGAIADAFNKMVTNLSETVSKLQSQIVENNELMNDLQLEMNKTDRANSAKHQFLDNVQHEFRTPMNSVISFAKLLEKDLPEEKFNKYTDQIIRNGNYLLHLIDGIIDLTQFESGEIIEQHEDFSLYDLCKEVTESYKSCLKSDDIKLTFEYDERLDKYYISEPRRIRQLLINLMNNAVKFTNRGEIGLKVIQLFKTFDSTKIKIIIADTGSGIDAKILQQLFPSGKNHKNHAGTSIYEGPGLGLSIVKKSVRSLNGTIELKSDNKSGTIIEIMLDLENSDQSQFDVAEIKDTLSTRPINILIAEDDSTNQMILEEFFSDLCVSYKIVENGEDAVKEIGVNKYDIILMDIQMPIMDGLTATKLIREHGIHTPVIAVSAHIQKEHVSKAIESGCNEFITKPIDFDLLKFKINSLI